LYYHPSVYLFLKGVIKVGDINKDGRREGDRTLGLFRVNSPQKIVSACFSKLLSCQKIQLSQSFSQPMSQSVGK